LGMVERNIKMVTQKSLFINVMLEEFRI